jgi:hypothetical protein
MFGRVCPLRLAISKGETANWSDQMSILLAKLDRNPLQAGAYEQRRVSLSNGKNIQDEQGVNRTSAIKGTAMI